MSDDLFNGIIGLISVVGFIGFILCLIFPDEIGKTIFGLIGINRKDDE